MEIVIHPHAKARLSERGVSETEVLQTLEEGVKTPTKFGRLSFKYTFDFNAHWQDKFYSYKEVEVIAVQTGPDELLAITTIARYF